MTEEVVVQQPAPEPTVTAEAPATRSMDDTIRDTYKALSEPKAETPETPETKPDRLRAANGRYAKADGTPEELVVDPAAPPEGEVEPEAKPPASAFPDAPNSWAKDAKDGYTALPDNIKAEIHRREGDFHKGLEQYKGMAHIGRVLDDEIRPYAELIQQNNTNAPAVIRDLLSTQKALVTGTPEQKAQVIARILRDYQVDTAAVNRALENPVPQPDPQYSQLASEVQQLRGQLSQAQLAPYIEQVNSFASNPANEFFAQVEDDMNALLKEGRAKDLTDAYNKASWANPETRAKLLAKQQEDERRKTAEKAAAAKQAGSTNVKPRGTPPQTPANGTMEDTIRTTYRKLNG